MVRVPTAQPFTRRTAREPPGYFVKLEQYDDPDHDLARVPPVTTLAHYRAETERAE